MDVPTIVGLVERILAAELKVPERQVAEAKSLRRECGMDSIAAANAAFALEEQCGVEISVAAEDSFDTVDDVVAVVVRALNGQ